MRRIHLDPNNKILIQPFTINGRAPGAAYHVAPQTNPDSQPRSELTLELHSRATSSVGVMSAFQRSQHRKQFWRKADNKKTVLTSFKTGDNVMTSFKTGDNATGFQMAEDS